MVVIFTVVSVLKRCTCIRNKMFRSPQSHEKISEFFSSFSDLINKLIKTPEIRFNAHQVVTHHLKNINNYYFYGMKNATTDLVNSFLL